MAVTDKPKPGTETIGQAVAQLSAAAKKFWTDNPITGAKNFSSGLIAWYWLKAGGNPNKVNEAVAASLGESRGNPNAVSPPNGDGSRDVGLWQVNTVHGPQLASTDPLQNARAAVQLSHNGSDWSAWCTSYDNGICSPQGVASPHYRGAGLGNYQSGVPVLPAGVRQGMYAKDAIAGAMWAAEQTGGEAVGLNTPLEPVDSTGHPVTEGWGSKIPGIEVPGTIVDALGGGNTGKILAYVGYGLLAAFGAVLVLLALAVLVLALVEKQGALAALPGAGKLAGAASEVNAGITARGVRNQAKGADAARKTRPVRRLHGEKGNGQTNPTPTHGGPGQRRARRVHDAGTNVRSAAAARYIGRGRTHGPTREQAGSPF